MKRFIPLVFISIAVSFFSSANLLKAAGSSPQDLERAIFEKNLDDDQKTFLKEIPLDDYQPFKKIVFKKINEVTNTYEYYTPEESQGLLFVQWLAFFDKHFEEFKDIFPSAVECKIPLESHFYPILSEKNFKALESGEKRTRIIQLLYQARYALRKFLEESSESLKEIYAFNKNKSNKVFEFPSLQSYLKDLTQLVVKEKLPAPEPIPILHAWLDFIDKYFQELNLKDVFPIDFVCDIPSENLSYPVPLIKDFAKLEVEEKRKQIIQSLYQARGELENYFAVNKKSLQKVLSLDTSKKIIFLYEPYNTPSLKSYLQQLIVLAASEKQTLTGQISKLHQSLELLKNKLSLLKSTLQEVKSELIKPKKFEPTKESEEAKPEDSEETKPEESDKFKNDAESSESKPTESESTKAEPENSEILKEAIPKKDGSKLEHLTKNRPMRKPGRTRPTRKPRVIKSDKQDQESEELDKKFEEYTQELKIQWIQEQKTLSDQLGRYSKTYKILKNPKIKEGIKKLSLLAQKVGEIMSKKTPDEIVQIPSSELAIEIESIKNDMAAKIQIYKATVDSFEKIIALLKESDKSIESKKNELQKQSNYFGPAKLSVDDLLKMDVQKFESSIKDLTAVLQEF